VSLDRAGRSAQMIVLDGHRSTPPWGLQAKESTMHLLSGVRETSTHARPEHRVMEGTSLH
jgi:hypothetical protein